MICQAAARAGHNPGPLSQRGAWGNNMLIGVDNDRCFPDSNSDVCHVRMMYVSAKFCP